MEQNERVPFETLIKGEYKEDFRRKVEEILRRRFKNQPKADPEADFQRLLASAQAARQQYPGLDLRKELASPQFADMVLRGVDVKAAYDAAHHDEMLRGAMAYAVRQASEKLARARAGRPAEYGAESRAAAVEKPDPRSLTAEERAEIRRRVLERGEKVSF